jgi:hypothetical protein
LKGRVSSDEFERILMSFVSLSQNQQDSKEEILMQLSKQFQVPLEKLRKALSSVRIPKPIQFEYPPDWNK